MKLIYAYIALLTIVIVGVGLFVIQWYTMPQPKGKNELSALRINLALAYQKRAELLSESAMVTTNRLKAMQGNLTEQQEQKINRLLDRAKELKSRAEKMKKRNIREAESTQLLRACNEIYGEASAICRQLQTETNK